jgi:hypothetical protein
MKSLSIHQSLPDKGFQQWRVFSSCAYIIASWLPSRNQLMMTWLESKSKLSYNWLSLGQSVFVSSPICGPRPDFCCCRTVAGLLVWSALTDERVGLSFTIAAGPHQCSHSQVWVSCDSWPYSHMKSTNHMLSLCKLLLVLFYTPAYCFSFGILLTYIDTAWTRITGNMSHDH